MSWTVKVVQRVEALGQWKQALQRGVLPDTDNMDWPPEPLAGTLSNVSMSDRLLANPESQWF